MVNPAGINRRREVESKPAEAVGRNRFGRQANRLEHEGDSPRKLLRAQSPASSQQRPELKERYTAQSACSASDFEFNQWQSSNERGNEKYSLL